MVLANGLPAEKVFVGAEFQDMAIPVSSPLVNLRGLPKSTEGPETDVSEIEN